MSSIISNLNFKKGVGIYDCEYQREYNLIIMSILKNKTVNLRVWIEHYLWQGVEHFYLINNGSIGSPLDILKEYIDRGIITYYNKEEQNQDVRHYRYVFDNEKLKEKTKWLCICDLDEFFFGTEKIIIDTFDEFDNYDIIYTNSYFYGSDNTKRMNEITHNDKIRLNQYRVKSLDFVKNITMSRKKIGYYMDNTNEDIRDLTYFPHCATIDVTNNYILNPIIENGYDYLKLNSINTAVIVEPRFLKHLPFVINDFYKKLGSNWKIVFYCGESLKNIWLDLLHNPNIDIRELKNDCCHYNDYCDFIKSKELWENLYGDYVLLFKANSTIINKQPYTIDYFMSLNKSYIGGNQSYLWNELEREKIYPQYANFHGGLSLRKRLDMIKIINTFGTQKTLENFREMTSLQTDAEDIYFTIGCYKLGLPVGDDEICSHFSVHNYLKRGFFAANSLDPGHYLNLIQQHDNICDNVYLFKDIKDIENEILSVHPSNEFFSNCTIRLFDIILYFNSVKKLPIYVDSSRQFDLYKSGTNINDITYKYFLNNFDFEINYEYPINFREQYQYSDYETLNFNDLNPFIKKYFTPSEDITNDIRYIEHKYKINNYDDICVLFYMSNDPKTDVFLPSYESIMEKARTLYNENNNIKFLVHSDEIEFIKYSIQNFPNNSLYFKDEIISIKNINYLSSDEATPESNIIYSQYYLAITIIMSKCKYILSTTCNCSLWIVFFRGGVNNFYQIK